ncbi:unnamed protein product [Symbiodinium sp. CCMP2456]|nr:unnamed protein product [Symbiodinium sp. CCMP2456]
MCRYDQFREKLEREGDICQYVEALVKMAGSEVQGLSSLRGVCDFCSKPPAPWEDIDCCALLSSQQLNRTEDATSIKLLEQRVLQVRDMIHAANRTIGNNSMAGRVLAAARENAASNLQNIRAVLRSHARDLPAFRTHSDGEVGQPQTSQLQESTSLSSWFGQQSTGPSWLVRQPDRSQESSPLTSWFGGREGPGPQQTGPSHEFATLGSWLGGYAGPGQRQTTPSQEPTPPSSWFGQQTSPSQESTPWLGGSQQTGPSRTSAALSSWFGEHVPGQELSSQQKQSLTGDVVSFWSTTLTTVSTDSDGAHHADDEGTSSQSRVIQGADVAVTAMRRRLRWPKLRGSSSMPLLKNQQHSFLKPLQKKGLCPLRRSRRL